MKQIYYKVVSQRLTSCVVEHGEAEVKYKVGEYVRANIRKSPLCIFNSLDHAQVYVSRTGLNHSAIYSCHAKCVSSPLFNRALSNNLDVLRFWKYINSLKDKHKKVDAREINYRAGCTWPYGTLWAREVKLVSKLVGYGDCRD